MVDRLISGIIYLFENGWVYIRGAKNQGSLKVRFYGNCGISNLELLGKQ